MNPTNIVKELKTALQVKQGKLNRKAVPQNVLHRVDAMTEEEILKKIKNISEYFNDNSI